MGRRSQGLGGQGEAEPPVLLEGTRNGWSDRRDRQPDQRDRQRADGLERIKVIQHPNSAT